MPHREPGEQCGGGIRLPPKKEPVCITMQQETVSEKKVEGLGASEDHLKVISRFDLNNGELAKLYASLPYAYYKEVTYPIFGELLDLLGENLRVLDVGAGCGHFAFEYYKQRLTTKTDFVLIDKSAALLHEADKLLDKLGRSVSTYQRSFNHPNWQAGLGNFNAIVSHNALFHLRPEHLENFYREAFSMLAQDGMLLTQLSSSPKSFLAHFNRFYRVLGHERFLSEEDKLRTSEMQASLEVIEQDLRLRYADEIDELLKRGYIWDEEANCSNLELTVDAHITAMKRAGFKAAQICQVMHFSVLAGVK